MKSIGRSILAVVVGVLLAGIVIFALEAVSHAIYPPPPGADWNDPAAMAEIVRTMPVGTFLLVLAAWGLGAFVGAFAASKIMARPTSTGIIVTALLLVGAVATMLMIPHPVWMWIGAFVVIPAAGFFGGRMGSPRVNMSSAS